RFDQQVEACDLQLHIARYEREHVPRQSHLESLGVITVEEAVPLVCHLCSDVEQMLTVSWQVRLRHLGRLSTKNVATLAGCVADVHDHVGQRRESELVVLWRKLEPPPTHGTGELK